MTVQNIIENVNAIGLLINIIVKQLLEVQTTIKNYLVSKRQNFRNFLDISVINTHVTNVR